MLEHSQRFFYLLNATMSYLRYNNALSYRSTVLKRTPRATKPNKEGKPMMYYFYFYFLLLLVAVDYLLNSVTLTQGVYSSSCGHGMHMECWRRFHDSRVTELRQSESLFQRRTAVNYEGGEFLCPLCQYYCNTILPVHPDPLHQRYQCNTMYVCVILFICFSRKTDQQQLILAVILK